MTRILVTGSRDWSDREAVEMSLLTYHMLYGDNIVVVHGDCPTGADRIAKEFCEEMDIKQDKHPADWGAHGKAAGPLRNQKMVDLGADACLAFPLEGSRGTVDCMERAEAAGITVLNLGEMA